MSIPESEIFVKDLLKVASLLEVKMHSRTIESIKRRIIKIIIGRNGGFGISFYRSKSGAGICDGVKRAIWKILKAAEMSGNVTGRENTAEVCREMAAWTARLNELADSYRYMRLKTEQTNLR